MRAVWKGHLRFSLVAIPVKIFTATESRTRISFNQLHRADFGRIGYEKRCKKCGQTVSNDDIVKGYEYEPDQYAIIEDDEVSELTVTGAKVIEIESFVDIKEVHPMLFDAPYYAGPDGPVAAENYALLREALERSGKMGVGRVVMSGREHVVVISPHGAGMVMYKIRYPNEVRDIEAVPELVRDGEVDERKLKLATSLIEELTTPFDELELEDRYQAALSDLVNAKIEGREVVTVEEAPAPAMDIMSALEESIERARSAKEPMKKAAGKKGAAAKEKKKTGS